METPEKQIAKQIFEYLCSSILAGEWKENGYICYINTKSTPKFVLDGTGSPTRWSLEVGKRYDQDFKKFNEFTRKQNRKLTKLLKSIESRKQQTKAATHAKEILDILDPDAGIRDAAQEVKTWIGG